jgi:hypothetical protein
MLSASSDALSMVPVLCSWVELDWMKLDKIVFMLKLSVSHSSFLTFQDTVKKDWIWEKLRNVEKLIGNYYSSVMPCNTYIGTSIYFK